MTDFTLSPATEADFERLVALRLLAMRESLDRLGRFDPDRARLRFREGFDPAHTRLIHQDDALVGCFTLRPGDDGALWLEHFYLYPKVQGRGLGGAVMRALLAETRGRTLRLCVLRESDANRFYPRFGFVETHREAWDIYYERPPGP